MCETATVQSRLAAGMTNVVGGGSHMLFEFILHAEPQRCPLPITHLEAPVVAADREAHMPVVSSKK